MARLILDTGALVAAARGRSVFADQDDIVLPAIAVAESLAGVHSDGVPARQAAQRAFLDEVLEVVPVVEYDRVIAVEHADLLAHVRRSGDPRGPHDLIIAATARALGRELVTTDAKARFGELPGVSARIVDR